MMTFQLVEREKMKHQIAHQFRNSYELRVALLFPLSFNKMKNIMKEPENAFDSRNCALISITSSGRLNNYCENSKSSAILEWPERSDSGSHTTWPSADRSTQRDILYASW